MAEGESQRISDEYTLLSRSGEIIGCKIVRKFPFAFDLADLATGASVYTPTPGDVLCDAWFDILTPWNGATPSGDCGLFTRSFPGLFWTIFDDGVYDMTKAEDATINGLALDYVKTATSAGLTLAQFQVINSSALSRRSVPARFVTDDPICVVVSQDGTVSGGNPGSTQGKGILYLETTSPV